jgi:hypothetical protein
MSRPALGAICTLGYYSQKLMKLRKIKESRKIIFKVYRIPGFYYIIKNYYNIFYKEAT